MKLGAFKFDSDFIISNFSDRKLLVQIKDLESYFPIGFRPAIDYKGSWSIDKSKNMIVRHAHDNRETIGDMRVTFYSL